MKTAPTHAKPKPRPTLSLGAALLDEEDAGLLLLVVFVLVVFEAVPLSCLARAWKAVKLFAPESTGLTANTMPAPQWLVGLVCWHYRFEKSEQRCRCQGTMQRTYAQIGVVSLITMLYEGKFVELAATGMLNSKLMTEYAV